MRRGPRQLLLAALVVVAVVFAATWYSRLQRCQAELAAWAQIRAALIGRSEGSSLLLNRARQNPSILAMLDDFGVLRTEAAVQH